MAQLHLTWLDNSLTREKNRGPCLCLCTVELGIHREIDVDDNLLYIFTTDKMFDYHCFKCCLDFMTYSISGTTLLPHGDNSSLVRSPRKLVQRISFQNSSSSPGNQSVTFSSGSGTHYEIWNWKISVIWSSMVSSILRQWKIPYFVFLRRELSNICLCLPESKAGWSKIYYFLYTENKLSLFVKELTKYFDGTLISVSIPIKLPIKRFIEEVFIENLDQETSGGVEKQYNVNYINYNDS